MYLTVRLPLGRAGVLALMRARMADQGTVSSMETRELQKMLLPTPFVSSFVGRARTGDQCDKDQSRRSAAWAQWAVSSLTMMVGHSDRSYAALVLPGRFYDPKGTGPSVRPHLEVPAWRLDAPAPEFPDRLAQMGNGLTFAWWMVPEVTAARRALFNTAGGDVSEALKVLVEQRPSLVSALEALGEAAMPQWSIIEGLLVSHPDGLAQEAAGDFSVEEVAEYFPAGAHLKLKVTYDEKLRSSSGAWASRRVGVWQLSGVDQAGKRLSLGVVTPRLTRNSLFRDPLYSPSTESAAALLVRGLVLRRLLDTHLSPTNVQVALAPSLPGKGGPHLRAVVARAGAKFPEASLEAAVNFLQTHTDPARAWDVLHRWSEAGYLLTVSKEGFMASHASASKALGRAEGPEREDINVILPLAWDDSQRVVRATFSRPSNDEQ